MAFVFMYNAALAFQLLALSSDDKDSRSLRKAVQLYQMASSLTRRGTFPVALEELEALQSNLYHAKRMQQLSQRLLLPVGRANDHAQHEAVWNGFLSVLLKLCVFARDPSAPAA